MDDFVGIFVVMALAGFVLLIVFGLLIVAVILGLLVGAWLLPGIILGLLGKRPRGL